ncbi:hypothetical protein P261_01262 [Lachnospiraceae bacterium TWA4]|nr:hypothetical protein P261_01262 [Lachnospiraceae bacterium TWA4]
MEDHNHKITMISRLKLEMTGVLDVHSLDENEAVVETSEGNLLIKGNDLHVKQLDLEKGQLSLEGHIDGLEYTKVVAKTSFVHRIFK